MLHALALALLLDAAPAPAVAADSLRADTEIRQTILRHAADVRGCYEREGLRRDPSLVGTLEVEVTVLPTGVVDSVAVGTVVMAGNGQREVAACIATVARHWRFERGPYAVETIVLPFALVPERPTDATAIIAKS
ncbi:MAG TPA: AgmX/PglI C-terminal domain-containing protein [Gemmatimonadaceae bacterium]